MMDYRWKLKIKPKRRKGYNPDQPRVPAGSPTGGQWAATGSGAPWATSARVWLEGKLPPAELYDGLSSNRGGKIRVRRFKDGTYNVVHDMGGELKVPYVTRGNEALANDNVQRLYGGPLSLNYGDLIKQHRKIVKAAIRRGESVPEEVLRDYPDLRSR